MRWGVMRRWRAGQTSLFCGFWGVNGLMRACPSSPAAPPPLSPQSWSEGALAQLQNGAVPLDSQAFAHQERALSRRRSGVPGGPPRGPAAGAAALGPGTPRAGEGGGGGLGGERSGSLRSAGSCEEGGRPLAHTLSASLPHFPLVDVPPALRPMSAGGDRGSSGGGGGSTSGGGGPRRARPGPPAANAALAAAAAAAASGGPGGPPLPHSSSFVARAMPAPLGATPLMSTLSTLLDAMDVRSLAGEGP
jgi:hypothetical protein